MAFNSPRLFQSIIDWIASHGTLGKVFSKWLNRNIQEVQTLAGNDCRDLYQLYLNGSTTASLAALARMKTLACPQLSLVETPVSELQKLSKNPSVYIAEKIQESVTNSTLNEVMESMGALVYDSVLNMALPKYPRANAPELEGVRKFIGSVTALSMAPSLVSPVVEFLTAGQIEKAGEPLRNLYWNLGLGFVTWQMTSPLIDNGIAKQLERRVLNFYRPTRFSQSQIMDLYSLGKYSATKTVEELKNLGWRDEDIGYIRELSATKLGVSQYAQLWEIGEITQADFINGVKQLGYNDFNANRLAKIHKPQADTETPKTLASTLTNGFEEGFLSQDEFVNAMESIGYSTQEITLRTQIVFRKRQEKILRLAKADVEKAWKAGQITTTEATTYLQQAGFNAQSIKDLLDTWKAENTPKVLQLNKTTILQAYDAGVFNKDAAKSRLLTLGYNSANADIIINTHDKLKATRNIVKPKAAPISVLLASLDYNLRTRTEIVNGIIATGYTASIAELIVKTHEITRNNRNTIPVRKLAQGTILDAFETGVITETTARARLRLLNYSDGDATIILNTKKQQIARANAPVIKEVGRNNVEKAYQLGVITRTVANDKLISLGYTTSDAKLLLDTVDKVIAINNQIDSINTPNHTILTALEYAQITRPAALSYLVGNGYTTTQANLLIDTHLETVRRRNLVTPTKVSTSFIVDAYRNSLINDTTLQNRLIANGYSQADAFFIRDTVNIQKTIDEATGHTVIDRVSLFNAYNLGIINLTALSVNLERLGYTTQDIAVLIELNNRKQIELNRVELKSSSQTDIVRAYRVGVITRDEAEELLEIISIGVDAITLILDTIDRENQEKASDAIPRLTRSEIERAYRLGIIQRGIAIQELVQSGLNINDANVLIASVDAEILRSSQSNPRVLSRGVYVSAYIENLITKSELLQSLRDIGYTSSDAQLLSTLADREKEQANQVQDRGLSVSTVLQSLSVALIDEVEARERIVSLGYSEADSSLLIATHRRLKEIAGEEPPRQLSQQIILDMLDSEVIIREDAVRKLSDLGFTPEDVTLLLQQYDRMREQIPVQEDLPVNRSTIIDAFQLGLINRQETISRLVELGYSQDDAEFIIDVETTVGEEPTPIPTVDSLVEALRKGLIPVEVFRQGLRELGIDEDTIQALEQLALADENVKLKNLTVAQTIELYTGGKISQSEAISRLVSLDYSSDSAQELLYANTDRLTGANLQSVLVQKGQNYPSMLEFLVQRGYDQSQAQATILSILPRMSTGQTLSLYQNLGFPREIILPMLREQFYSNEQIELLLELYRPEET